MSYVDVQGLLLGATLGGLQRGITLNQATQIGLMGNAALKAGGATAAAGAAAAAAATGAPEAAGATARVCKKIYDVREKLCRAGLLVISLCTVDPDDVEIYRSPESSAAPERKPSDDILDGFKKRDDLRNESELSGQKKIGNQQQRP